MVQMLQLTITLLSTLKMFVREDCTHVHSATDVCVCVCVDVASPYEDILFCACFRTLRKIFFLHDHFYSL